MKKNLLFLLGMLLALPGIARDFSYTYEGQTLTYTVIDEDAKTCKTKEGSGYPDYSPGNYVREELIIPDIAKDGDTEYSVIEIGKMSFYKSFYLTQVTIPNSVKSIGEEAFLKCGLTQVTIPNSVDSIGYDAFYWCENLTQVTLGNSVEYIGEEAFLKCGLTQVTIPNSVEFIGSYAFYLCDLTQVTIGNSVKYIGASAFNSNHDMAKVEFASIEALCAIEFADGGANPLCNSGKIYIGGEEVSDVVIPESVTAINDYTFFGCSLKSVSISNSVESIGYHAFSHCGSLSSVIIPNSVRYIGNGAFENCGSLFSVMYLPKGASLGDDIFSGCSIFRKVACYESEWGAFENYSSLGSAWAIEDGETVDPEKGIIWASDANENPYPWVSGCYKGKLVLPEKVTELLWSCMAVCPEVTEVILPNSLETIGQQAFYRCTGLRDITIPYKVSNVADNMFQDTQLEKIAYPDCIDEPYYIASERCIRYDAFDAYVDNGYVFSRRKDKLYYVPISVGEKYEVPETVKEITDKAFLYCDNLISVTLPAGLSGLGSNVWGECPDIKTIICKSSTPVAADRNLFMTDVYDTATLYVPYGSKNEYENVIPWRYFYNIEEADVENLGGLDEINCDDTPYEIYDLNGLKISKSLDSLTRGIYIIRRGNTVKKVAVQ